MSTLPSQTALAVPANGQGWRRAAVAPGSVARGARQDCPQCCETVPTGACCVGSTCSILNAAQCAAAGGVYYGDGSGCDPSPCPPPDAGCCSQGWSCWHRCAQDGGVLLTVRVRHAIDVFICCQPFPPNTVFSSRLIGRSTGDFTRTRRYDSTCMAGEDGICGVYAGLDGLSNSSVGVTPGICNNAPASVGVGYTWNVSHDPFAGEFTLGATLVGGGGSVPGGSGSVVVPGCSSASATINLTPEPYQFCGPGNFIISPYNGFVQLDVTLEGSFPCSSRIEQLRAARGRVIASGGVILPPAAGRAPCCGGRDV